MPPTVHAPTRGFGLHEPDLRSVGELLLDADFLARQLLFDVGSQDIAGLIRGWPGIARAALQLWTALHPDRAPLSPPPPTSVLRAEEMVTRTITSRSWPGPGRFDDRLVQIGSQIERAAELVTRLSADVPYGRRDVEADAAVARYQATHAVYVSAHAVSVALHERGGDLYRHPPRDRHYAEPQPGGSVHHFGRIGSWIDTFDRVERRILTHLTARPTSSRTVSGIADDDQPELDRQERALERWHQQALRTLAAPSPRAVDLALVCSTQAFIADAVHFMLEALCTAKAERLASAVLLDGLLGPGTTDVVTAIDHSAHTWRVLATQWSALVGGPPQYDPALISQAGHIRAALQALTHDRAVPAEPEIVVRRVSEDLTLVVAEALDQADEVADNLAETIVTSAMQGSAQRVSVLAHNLVEASQVPDAVPVRDILWVRPQDVVANHLVPVPRPVMDQLSATAAANCLATRSAGRSWRDGTSFPAPHVQASTAGATAMSPLSMPRRSIVASRQMVKGPNR